MTEPSLALQKAFVTALRADAALSAIVAGRVYDRIDKLAVKPYIRVGEDQVLPARAECLERSVEVTAAIHIWSEAVGKVEAKRIGGAIVDALDDAALDLGPDLALVLIEHRQSRYLDDPGGLITHGVITFRALVDAA